MTAGTGPQERRNDARVHGVGLFQQRTSTTGAPAPGPYTHAPAFSGVVLTGVSFWGSVAGSCYRKFAGDRLSPQTWRMRVNRAYRTLGILLLAFGCTERTDELQITDVSPRLISVGGSRWVEVRGTGFSRVRVRLEGSSKPTVNRIDQLWVGDLPVPLTEVELLGEGELRFLFPELLPIGTYPLTLGRTDGATAQDSIGLTMQPTAEQPAPGVAPAPETATPEPTTPEPTTHVTQEEVPTAPANVPDTLPDAGIRPEPDPPEPEPEPQPPLLAGEFGNPRRLTELSRPEFYEDDPAVSGDCLELYFSRVDTNDGASGELLSSRRVDMNQPWGAPEAATELNTPSNDATPWLSRDGLTIWFASARGGLGATDLLFSERPSRSSPWGVPQHAAELNSQRQEIAPALSDDLLEIFFVSNRDRDRDIYHASRVSLTSPWSTPEPIAAVNSTSGEDSVHVVGNQLVFSSWREGDADFYLSSRAARFAPFEAPAPWTELNTGGIEVDASFGADGGCLIFGSDRDGSPELYEMRR